MKNILFKILTLSNFIFYSSLYAVDKQDFKEIVNSFKLKDTSEQTLKRTYKINEDIITSMLNKKQEDEKRSQWIEHIITFDHNNSKSLGDPNYWHSINKYDQKLYSVACISLEKKTILASIARFSFQYKENNNFISYAGFVASIDKNTCCGNYDTNGGLFDESNQAGAYTAIPNYDPKKFYPYYNEEKMLERLYETQTCNKTETEKANIKVLVDGKWINQEKSWKE